MHIGTVLCCGWHSPTHTLHNRKHIQPAMAPKDKGAMIWKSTTTTAIKGDVCAYIAVTIPLNAACSQHNNNHTANHVSLLQNDSDKPTGQNAPVISEAMISTMMQTYFHCYVSTNWIYFAFPAWNHYGASTIIYLCIFINDKYVWTC